MKFYNFISFCRVYITYHYFKLSLLVCRSCSISYTFLASFSATGATIEEIFTVLQGELPYREWVPYDTYTSLLLFLFTSLQLEMLALVFGTIINIATETLVLGFCLQTCSNNLKF